MGVGIINSIPPDPGSYREGSLPHSYFVMDDHSNLKLFYEAELL
jgi:hypothetical protein